MRNSQAHSDFAGGRPRPGVRFFNIGVNIVNTPNNPIRTWIINDGVNPVVTIKSPDLGLLLHPTLVLDPSHPPLPPPFAVPRAVLAENFKIPTLWGVKDTAPYFQDNGAKRFATPSLTTSGSSTSRRRRTRLAPRRWAVSSC